VTPNQRGALLFGSMTLIVAVSCGSWVGFRIYREFAPLHVATALMVGPDFDVRVDTSSTWNGLAARQGWIAIMTRLNADSEWTLRHQFETLAPEPIQQSAISFVDAQHAFIVGFETVATTHDGGITWQEWSPPRLRTQSGRPAVAVTVRVRIGTDGSGSFELVEVQPPSKVFARYQTADFGRTWAEQLPN
jgi:hypothetical protein